MHTHKYIYIYVCVFMIPIFTFILLDSTYVLQTDAILIKQQNKTNIMTAYHLSIFSYICWINLCSTGKYFEYTYVHSCRLQYMLVG